MLLKSPAEWVPWLPLQGTHSCYYLCGCFSSWPLRMAMFVPSNSIHYSKSLTWFGTYRFVATEGKNAQRDCLSLGNSPYDTCIFSSRLMMGLAVPPVLWGDGNCRFLLLGGAGLRSQNCRVWVVPSSTACLTHPKVPSSSSFILQLEIIIATTTVIRIKHRGPSISLPDFPYKPLSLKPSFREAGHWLFPCARHAPCRTMFCAHACKHKHLKSWLEFS